MRSAVEEELDHLERTGVLEKVNHSEWAAPTVAVPNKDGRVRLCGDYKVTVNPVLSVDQYPLPRSTDLFATLTRGKYLSTLDLSHAKLSLTTIPRHTSRSIPIEVLSIYQITFWSGLGTSLVSEIYEYYPTRAGWCHMPFR